MWSPTQAGNLHTTTNMEESERDTAKQRQNEALVAERGAATVTWMWIEYEVSINSTGKKEIFLSMLPLFTIYLR